MSGQFGSAYPTRPSFTNTAQPPAFGQPGAAPHEGFGRKRRASSPDSESGQGMFGAHHESKRRRPNLQNGFATMSISPRQGSTEPEPAQGYGARVDDDDGSTDDGLEPTRPPLDGDVGVEVLSDKHHSPTTSTRSRPPPWDRNASFSSNSPSEDDYDSDATFRPPMERARLRQAHNSPVLPTSVEHPERLSSPHAPHSATTPTVEPLDSPMKRKHLMMGEDAPRGPNGNGDDDDGPQSKRQRGGMDMDDEDMGRPPVASGHGWYEPEKDRIVVTSLQDSPSPEAARASRSPSPDSGPRRAYSYEDNKNLSQPGNHGFTISPSLLTHIMAAQGDRFRSDMSNVNSERGLVLYRPIGAPGGPPAAQNVVREWDGTPFRSAMGDDSDRFQEVNEDDDEVMASTPAVGVPMDSPWGMPANGFGQQQTQQPFGQPNFTQQAFGRNNPLNPERQNWGTGSSNVSDDAMDVE